MSIVELQPVCTTPLDESLPRLRRFVSEFTGVVHATSETLHTADEFRLVSIGCELADTQDIIGTSFSDPTGSSQLDRGAALAATIGEALERYSASYLPPGAHVILASARDLGPEAVDPAQFALFSEAQHADPEFPYERFIDTTVIRWVRGFELPSGQPKYLPLQLTYMPWHFRQSDEAAIGHATSSGIACGPTLEEAILTGLLEVIERDAVMLTWYNRLSLPRLEWTGHAGLTALAERYFEPAGLRYTAVDLSVFLGVPTAFGVVRGHPGVVGAIGVGAGSAPTVEVAWRKALAEAFSVQRWIRDRALEAPERVGLDADEIATFTDHCLYYVTHDRAELTSFLDASPETVDVGGVGPLEGDTVLGQIEAIMRRLHARGVTAYAVDITAPDVRDAGFAVAHVIAPELCPLDVLAGVRFLGARRLYTAAYESGLVPAPLTGDDLNPLPHPFP